MQRFEFWQDVVSGVLGFVKVVERLWKRENLWEGLEAFKRNKRNGGL